MPVPERTRTSDIVQNIRLLVKKYNDDSSHCKYIRDYNYFMTERNNLLRTSGSFDRLLSDPKFSERLHGILAKFGMNARTSRLMSSRDFRCTLSDVGPEFDLLNGRQIQLHSVSLYETVEGQTAYSIIRTIFNFFREKGKLSEAGGFVIASKTMHFVMPELFIMVDNQHTATSLYNIADYHPHFNDGKDWAHAIPDYSGLKPNPSPRGGGRKLWDNERYCIAIMYYKRIFQNWCTENNSSIDGFLDLDAQNASTAARTIDKALW